jgi:hypothetical protein
MVAYSFQRQFAEPIVVGTKGGTIRADRRRHARPGEEMQLYVGMRTKHCRLIGRRICLAIEPVLLDFGRRKIIVGSEVIAGERPLEAFARFDGFPGFDVMQLFWSGSLERIVTFEGWHIRWLPLPPPMAMAS